MTTNRPAADLLTAYYAAMEGGDPAKFGSYYADDMTLTFGNSPTITGRQNVIDTMTTVLGTVRSLHHDLVHLWEVGNDVVVYESVGVWNLWDGQQVAIPACTVLTIVGAKFTDQRIYVDNAPVDAALARERDNAPPSTPAT
jgi:ketosteroid isomerase-like protein